MKNNNHGIAQVWIVFALGAALLGAGGATLKKFTGIFSSEDPAKAKAEAQALVDSNAKLAAAQAEATDLRAKAEAAAAAVIVQKQIRYAAAAEDVQGAILALKQEEAPSLNVTAALSYANSAAKALDPVADAKIAVLDQQVKQLTSQNAAMRASAEAERAAHDDAIAEARRAETALEDRANSEQLAREAAEKNAKLIGEEHTKLIATHEQTLAAMKTLGQKAESAGWWLVVTLGIFGGALWVLPIIAKAHPEVGWLTSIAKGAGAVTAYGLHLLHTGEQRALAAAVAEKDRLLAKASGSTSPA